MEDKVKEALEVIRKSLQAHDGDVEFVSMDGTDVKVRLQGHCVGCAYSQMTLKAGIERYLKQAVDENITVENVQ